MQHTQPYYRLYISIKAASLRITITLKNVITISYMFLLHFTQDTKHANL